MTYRITQLLLFLGFTLSLNAQTYSVTVGGTVTDANGAPVENANLMISTSQSDPAGFFHFEITQTNALGEYNDQFDVPNSVQQGSVAVALIDCDSNSATQTGTYGINLPNVLDFDFEFCGVPTGACNAWIWASYTVNGGNSFATLHAQASGVGPFTYSWSNAGSNFPDLIVTQSGTYCVVVTDADSCTTSACITVQLPGGNTCSVQTQVDSSNTGMVIVAIPAGTAPFAYLWNTGETTQTIPFVPGTNSCVTVTDANGCVAEDCLFGPSPTCSVSFATNPNSVSLTANPIGTAPFIFLWNTGQTSQSIVPSAAFGLYCVTVTDANGCTTADCIQWGGVGCGVTVFDSVPAPGGGTWLHANPWGQAPFTFQWNVQNASSQAILADSMGTYCVTITDATGCSASDCITLGFDSCFVYIQEGNASLFAVVSSAAGWTFEWSTGETSQTILPTGSGTYCVTATNSFTNCSNYYCYFYSEPVVSYGIHGFVLVPDSNVVVQLEGTAELYLLDPATGAPSLVDEVALQTSPAGTIGAFYNFPQAAAGDYIVKISLDPASPYFDEYLPTYFGNVLLWQNASEIAVPNSGNYYNIVLVDANPFGSGSGNGVIGGTVTDGDGFTANGNGNRGGGEPLPNISILLFNDQEQPITHTLTDAEGKYQFENLPIGTYKLGVEITGKEQAWRWVTLTVENPVAENQDFSVSESAVSDAGEQIRMAKPVVSAQPNPVLDVLTIKVSSFTTFEARLSLSAATGGKVFEQSQAIAKGEQTLQIQVADLPAGLYFLNLTGGSQVVSIRIVKH